jgi:hypothetical protein
MPHSNMANMASSTKRSALDNLRAIAALAQPYFPQVGHWQFEACSPP